MSLFYMDYTRIPFAPSLAFLLALLVFEALASPFPSTAIYSRDDPPTPAVSAKILDHSDNDITSSFQIMVYDEAEALVMASNLTDRRRQPVALSRPINDCHIRDSIFTDSFCIREDGNPSGMQAYQISCYVPVDVFHPDTGNYHASFHSMRRRDGYCEDDEVCVDGFGRSNGSTHTLPPGRGGREEGEHAMASCVKTKYFTKMAADNGKEPGQQVHLVSLEGRMASLAVSKPDGTTPVEVDTFGVKAVDAGGSPVQSKRCRDCMDLKTDAFGPKTDGLMAEARLLTTGAMAGILWLAVLSG